MPQAAKTPARRWPRLLLIAALVPPLGLFGLALASRSRPALGIDASTGSLRPLEDKPHGVSSLAKEDGQRVDALELGSIDSEKAKARLRELLKDASCELLEEGPAYLRFECRSRIFGFRDDLEFHVRDALDRVDIRAAARVGYSDLGANRTRVEALRTAWQRARKP